MAVVAQGKLPVYLLYMLGCALVVLFSVLYKEEIFASSVTVVEHPRHAMVNLHFETEYLADVEELAGRHAAGKHKVDVGAAEDLEDDQYMGQFEDDDDGSEAGPWEDGLEEWELGQDDDDSNTMYPEGQDSEHENTRDNNGIGRDGVTDDDEWLGEDPEDNIDPDYMDVDMFSGEGGDNMDDTLGMGPGGQELAEQKLAQEAEVEAEAGGRDGGEEEAATPAATPAAAAAAETDDNFESDLSQAASRLESRVNEVNGGAAPEAAAEEKKRKKSRKMLSDPAPAAATL